MPPFYLIQVCTHSNHVVRYVHTVCMTLGTATTHRTHLGGGLGLTAISVVKGDAGASGSLDDGTKGTAWLVTWTLTVTGPSSPVTPACTETHTSVHGTQYVRMYAIPPTNEWEARSLRSVCHSTEKVKL